MLLDLGVDTSVGIVKNLAIKKLALDTRCPANLVHGVKGGK